jgi:hypothetical protein
MLSVINLSQSDHIKQRLLYKNLYLQAFQHIQNKIYETEID